MEEQLSLFGVEEGRYRRDAGKASLERHPWITEARRKAWELCRIKGSVTSDDVQAVVPLPEGVHHNAWGAVFRHPYFAKTGRFVQSTRPAAHARWIQVWILGPEVP